MDDVTVYGHALAAAFHLVFALQLFWSARSNYRSLTSSSWLLMTALLATAAWCALTVASAANPNSAWSLAAAWADLARYACWFAFGLNLLKGNKSDSLSRAIGLFRVVAAAVVGLSATIFLTESRPLDALLGRGALACGLALGVLGLIIVEQIWRNVGEDLRWGAKPVCLGLTCVFAYDIYLFADALLLGTVDPDARALRGAVHTLAVPFLWLAASRRKDWLRRMQVSRTAAFYSATLVLAGGYLLFISALGYYVRYFGGGWGRALQLGLLAVALAMLVVLAFSAPTRAKIKVFVGKHFFSYRYDYREEWLRFTAMLSSRRSPQETGAMIVRGLAGMVDCPGGSLWARSAPDAPYAEVTCWNVPTTGASEPHGSAFCSLMRDKGWVVDLTEHRAAPSRYDNLVMPEWLLGSPNAWLVVPLLIDADMLGFVVLTRPRAVTDLNWEVLDLLKTAGRQAAGYLAQMQATDALLEARKFEAFNRMSAFVVHDLKNIVTQLSLMLKNAQRLRDNPEFQQDMLMTVENSLEKMRRLMLQLREGATPLGAGRGVELAPLLRRLESLASGQGRTLVVTHAEPLATRGHEDRLERVLGHLVQNALDATPVNGKVWVSIGRIGGQIKVDVGDSGAGMTEEFAATNLFRPFNTTKHNGMGIGTYESQQYIKELGGEITVNTKLGVGTVMSVLLPLFDGGGEASLFEGGP